MQWPKSRIGVSRAFIHEERNAWSLTMVRRSEQTTERYYGTMSEDRRFEVHVGIGVKKTIDPRNLSESEKAKIFAGLLEVFGGGG